MVSRSFGWDSLTWHLVLENSLGRSMDTDPLSGFDSDGGTTHVYDLSNGPRHPEDAVTDRHRVKEQELFEQEMSLARKEQSLRDDKRHEIEAREATLNARFQR
jgi:hypothetical protein